MAVDVVEPVRVSRYAGMVAFQSCPLVACADVQFGCFCHAKGVAEFDARSVVVRFFVVASSFSAAVSQVAVEVGAGAAQMAVELEPGSFEDAFFLAVMACGPYSVVVGVSLSTGSGVAFLDVSPSRLQVEGACRLGGFILFQFSGRADQPVGSAGVGMAVAGVMAVVASADGAI